MIPKYLNCYNKPKNIGYVFMLSFLSTFLIILIINTARQPFSRNHFIALYNITSSKQLSDKKIKKINLNFTDFDLLLKHKDINLSICFLEAYHEDLPIASIYMVPDVLNKLRNSYSIPPDSSISLQDYSYGQCHKLLNLLDEHYEFSIHSAHLKQRNYAANQSHKSFVDKWFRNFENKTQFPLIKNLLYDQKVVHVFNKITNEHTAFNLLRGMRKQKKKENIFNLSSLYINNLVHLTKDKCDFCNYKDNTVLDELNVSLSNKFAYSFSNAFKLDEWHSIIASKLHDPSALKIEDIEGMTDLSLVWYYYATKQYFKKYPASMKNLYHMPLADTFFFPLISWDNLPQGGASQVHPHLQCFLSKNRYYGKVHNLLQNIIHSNIQTDYDKISAEEFSRLIMKYIREFISIHNFLGLVVPCPESVYNGFINNGECVMVSHVTPSKENEFFIIYYPPNNFIKNYVQYNEEHLGSVEDLISVKRNDALSSFTSFQNAVFTIIDLYRNPQKIKDQKSDILHFNLGGYSHDPTYSFSASFIYPPIGPNVSQDYPFPVIARFVSRGLPKDDVSDISSLELFMINNVVYDPYLLSSELRQKVQGN